MFGQSHKDTHDETTAPLLQDSTPQNREASDDENEDEESITKYIRGLPKYKPTEGVPESPSRKKWIPGNSVVFSPESSMALFRGSNGSGYDEGSGHGRGSASNFWAYLINTHTAVTTDNRYRRLQKQSRSYQHVVKKSMLLAKQHFSADTLNYSLAISFFSAILLSPFKDFESYSLTKQLQKINAEADKLPSETFDLTLFFEYVNHTATEFYPNKPFAAKLLAAILLVEAGSVKNLLALKNDTLNELMIKTSLCNTSSALDSFRLDNLTTLKLAAQSLDENKKREFGPTLLNKINALNNETAPKYRQVKFLDTEVTAIRAILTNNGHEALCKLLHNSDIYNIYQQFDCKLQSIETAMPNHVGSIKRFTQTLFESYLIEHIDHLSVIKTNAVLIPEKMNTLWQIFSMQVEQAVGTFSDSTRIGHIYYMLKHHGQALLANPHETIREKYLPFYTDSNRNDGRNGAVMEAILAETLSYDLPKTLLNKNPQTKIFSFKTRDELASDKVQLERQGYVEYALYFTSVAMLMLDLVTASKVMKPALNPPGLTYFYFTGIGIATLLLGLLIRKSRLTSLREISETLDIFSQKKGPQLFLAHTDDFDSGEAHTNTVNPLSNRNADSSV